MSAGSLGWVIGIIGCFSDMIASSILNSLQTCVNKYNEFFGSHNSLDIDYAINCKWSSNVSSDLACTYSSGFCIYFEGTTDGNYILGSYSQLANAAKSLDFLLEISILFLTCLLYHLLGACCCNRRSIIYVAYDNQIPTAQVSTKKLPFYIIYLLHIISFSFLS